MNVSASSVEPSPGVHWSKILLGVFLYLIVSVTIFGNILVLMAVKSHKRLQTVFNNLRRQSGSHRCFSCCYRHELLHVGQYLGVLAVWADHVRCLDFLRLRNDVRVSFHSLHYLYWPVLGSELAYTLQVAQQHKESYWYGGWSLVSKFWKFSILLTNEMTYHTIPF